MQLCGPGFDPRAFAHLFEKLHRLDARVEAASGDRNTATQRAARGANNGSRAALEAQSRTTSIPARRVWLCGLGLRDAAGRDACRAALGSQGIVPGQDAALRSKTLPAGC
eukprot:3538955-Prymnesium_polylepis.1